MNNKEIVKAVLWKALRNLAKSNGYSVNPHEDSNIHELFIFIKAITHRGTTDENNKKLEQESWWRDNEIIFSVYVVKPFFGEFERKNPELLGTKKEDGSIYLDEDLIVSYGWQHYHHKMLDEVQKGRCPIKYLEQFL